MSLPIVSLRIPLGDPFQNWEWYDPNSQRDNLVKSFERHYSIPLTECNRGPAVQKVAFKGLKSINKYVYPERWRLCFTNMVCNPVFWGPYRCIRLRSTHVHRVVKSTMQDSKPATCYSQVTHYSVSQGRWMSCEETKKSQYKATEWS